MALKTSDFIDFNLEHKICLLVIESTQFLQALTINKVTCKEHKEKQVIYNGSPTGQMSWHASGTLHCSSDANQP